MTVSLSVIVLFGRSMLVGGTVSVTVIGLFGRSMFVKEVVTVTASVNGLLGSTMVKDTVTEAVSVSEIGLLVMRMVKETVSVTVSVIRLFGRSMLVKETVTVTVSVIGFLVRSMLVKETVTVTVTGFLERSMLVEETLSVTVSVTLGRTVVVEDTAVTVATVATVATVFAVSGKAIRSEVVMNLLLFFDQAAQRTVEEVFVVWVRRFCDNAAAKNRGLFPILMTSCGEQDSSGEKFLVAASEVLLEHGLVPSERAVCVFLHVDGVELALIW